MTTNIGIKPLKLEMDVGGGQLFVVDATVLWDEQELILVDTGLPGQLEAIRSAFQREALPFEKLTRIILTHQDMDHIGGLHDLAAAVGGRAQVLSHELCKPYIQGELPTIKRGALVPPTKVDVTLQDGDQLSYCGGIEVIFTPGHTPDHISLYHRPSRTLISGDALTSQDGVLMPPSRDFTPDMQSALESVAKLMAFEIDTVITYHGGVVTDRIQERLAEIAAGNT